MNRQTANPYESPAGLVRQSGQGRLALTAVEWLALAPPFLPLAALYGAWLLAWTLLGHRPRPALNDPAESLGPIYYLSGVAFFLTPVLGIISLSSVALFSTPRRRAVLGTLLLVGLWLVVLGLLRWDPLQVVDWWLD